MSYPESGVNLYKDLPQGSGEAKEDPRAEDLASEIYRMLQDAVPHLWNDRVAAANLLPVAGQLGKKQAELEEKLAEAKRLAVLDPFLKDVGFFGHQYFLDLLRKEEEAAKNMSTPDSAVITLDFDSFGLFNKQFGQFAGDQLLKAGAEAMLKAMRRGDDVGRTGGDEFSAIIRRTNIDGAVAVAKRMQAAVIRTSHEKFGAQGWMQTISLGVSLIEPGPDLLCKRVADQALIASKKAGGDTISIGRFHQDTNTVDTIVVAPRVPVLSK